jgi:hypothetical protein
MFNLKISSGKSSRKFTPTLFVLALVAAQIIPVASANAAEKGWRYWGYYQAAPGATKWTAAMTSHQLPLQ